MKLLLSLLQFGAAMATLASPLAAEDLTSRPTQEGPVEVRVQVVLIDLENISGADQNFTVNFAYMCRWQDDRLRHDGPSRTTVSLSDIWHPRIQIVNQQRIQKTFADEARVTPEGEVIAVQRVWGQLSQPLVLNDFPFDRQELRIDLVATGHEPGDVELVSDTDKPSAIANSLAISDWQVLDWSNEPLEVAITDHNRAIPAYRFGLSVERNYRYHLVNFILPLVLIICMSWVVFWINPKNANPRISVSVTAMLTLIAYRFAVGASLPKIGYLTRLDWFILGSSLVIFTSLLQVVITSYLADRDRIDTAVKINRTMRVIAPLAFLLVACASLWW